MIRYDNNTLAEYLEKLAMREPVPGGGSAAAVSGALGVALIEMVIHYSLGKGAPRAAEVKLTVMQKKAEAAHARLLELVSLDAEAYLKMREAKKESSSRYQTAMKQAAAVPTEIRKLCATALQNIAFLKKFGNPHLLSDVIAAEALLKAGIASAQAMIETNS